MRKLMLALLIVCALPEIVPAQAPAPGPFAAGRKRVGFYGGAGSTLGQTYAIVGGGAGYYLVDGLEAGADYEAWIGNSPSIQKLTPQLRYVVWQTGALKPYLGAFWRRTFMGSDWPDFGSWGGRFGLAYRQGGNYVAVGLVHERYIDNDDLRFTDDSQTYPEVAFWLSF